MNFLMVFIGGGIGASCRYGISLLANSYVQNFPLGTVIVNILGCFLAGFTFEMLTTNSMLKSLIGVGFLGGLTTFSSYSLELTQLVEQKKYFSGFMHWGIGTFFCVFSAFLGIFIAHKLYLNSNSFR